MKKTSRAQQIFLFAAPFLGLAFFKIWVGRGIESPTSLLAVAAALTVYCVLVLFIASRWDRPTYFDWVIAAYFAVITAFLAFAPEAAARLLSRYSVTGVYLCLFAAAFFPPLLGMKPFTYHYAVKYAPTEVWRNPVFLKINRIMTQVWQALFALCILISLYPSVVTRAFVPLALLLGIGLPFNLRFPNYYLKRLGLPSLAEQRRGAADGTLFQEGLSWSDARPENAREAIGQMARRFDPAAAENLSAVIRFEVDGNEPFNATLIIRDGACELEEESRQRPDLRIRTSDKVWLSICRGELNGQQAFTGGAYTAEGNLGILMRLGQIFGGRGPSQPSV